MAIQWRSLTQRPNAAIRQAIEAYFRRKSNHTKSNRQAAADLGVDEKTVRLHRARLKVPALTVGSGQPAAESKAVRRRTR
jgi:hypothetical protein